MGDAEGGELPCAGDEHPAAARVRLQLHEDAVGGRPAVGEQRLDGRDLAMHGGHDVLDLEGDRLQRRPRELGRSGAEGEPGEEPDGLVVPPRRAEAAERGDEVDAVAARGGVVRERFRRGAQHPGQPGQRRAARADVAFDGVPRRTVVPRDRRAQRLGAPLGQAAEAHDRRPRAVRGLHLAGAPAGVREQGGVRVAHHREHGDPVPKGREPADRRERARRRDDGRQHALRDPEELEQLGVPPAGAEVEQLRAGGVADLDHVVAAQAAEQPRVDGAQAELPAPAAGAVGVVGVEQPGGLRRREHRVDGQAAERAHALAGAFGAEPRAVGRRPLVLPAQQRADGVTARALPEHERLALRAQAHGGDGRAVLPVQAEGDGGADAVPDLGRRLLDPAGLRVGLPDGRRAASDDPARRRRRAPPWWRSSPGRSRAASA